MFFLQKITTEYVEHEDRVRLAGDQGGQDAVIIWLTQRLLQRLVPVLLEHLGLSAVSAQETDILQSFAQQAALAELHHESPVQAEVGSLVYLPSKVDIRKTSELVRLEFSCEQSPPVIFELGATTLRQWLAILHGQYIRAGWPLDVWPEWISAQQNARGGVLSVQ